MFSRGALMKALNRLEAKKCVEIVGEDGLREDAAAAEFVKLVREAGCLLVKHPDAAREKRRDELIEVCRGLLSPSQEKFKQDLENHIADARAVERGFREVLRVLERTPIWKRPAAQQAWGVIRQADRELAKLHETCERQVQAAARAREPIDVHGLRVEGPEGEGPRFDDAAEATVRVLSATLSLLGHVNGWFDSKSGVLVLPEETVVEENVISEGQDHLRLANQWRELEIGWDRSRFFGARVQCRSAEMGREEGNVRSVTVLEFGPPSEFEKLERIAKDRLLGMVHGAEMETDLHDIPKVRVGLSENGRVALAPEGYLTRKECETVELFRRPFCVPMAAAAEVMAGLALAAWLRGYAYLEKLADEAARAGKRWMMRLTEAELTSGLSGAGLSEAQASRFVLLASFQREAADLYDAPLLRTADGSYRFLPSIYYGPVLGVVLLSRFASLNRRRDESGGMTNDCQFQDKGKEFERVAKSYFDRANIPARQFEYSIGAENFDCDLAVVLDDTLFIFECKNHVLPLGSLPALYYLLERLRQSGEQVKRIAQQLDGHPEIVRRQFDMAVSWRRVVPVVLQAMPCSGWKLGDVHYFDASGLLCLLDEGCASVVSRVNAGKHGGGIWKYRHKLRQGAIPTAAELEREMADPHQLRVRGGAVELQTVADFISESFAFVLPCWAARTPTLEEELRWLGVNKREADKACDEYRSLLPKLEHVLKRTGKPNSAAKVGRNDPCPCGSGRKYKRCCGG